LLQEAVIKVPFPRTGDDYEGLKAALERWKKALVPEPAEEPQT
jgi:hypothetical protein